VVRLIVFVLPLAIDSFAIAATLGAVGVSRRQRWRIAAVFVAFEAGMPLIGLGLGAPLAHAIGGVADYLAAAALVAVGLWMLLGGDEDAEEEKARRLVGARGLAAVGLGLAISMDELAIGFSLGLTHLPPVEVVAAIAVQAFIAAQLGLALGARIGERWRENAERLAAVALLGLGVFVLVEHLVHH
jgi:putative Mn2+ efflux pump MntP